MKRTVSLSVSCLQVLSSLCGLRGAESYGVVDHSVGRNVVNISPQGVITPITGGVPWERASALAVDAQGNYLIGVNVYDGTGQRDGIYKVSPAGVIQPVVVGDPFDRPVGLAIDASGDYIVVEDPPHGDKVPKLLRVSPAGQVTVILEGVPLDSGLISPGMPNLLYPTDVAIDAQGRYVITDRGTWGRLHGQFIVSSENGAVYRFDPVTREFTTIRSSVDPQGNMKVDELLGHVASVAVDREGNYVVLEAPTHFQDAFGVEWKIPVDEGRIIRMRPNGELIREIWIPDLDDKIAIPKGLAIDSQGDYIVADAVGTTSSSGRLLHITPEGQVRSIVLSDALGAPKDIAILSTPPATQHRADFQPPYWRIDMTEVNRVLAYWRSGSYHRIPHGADGYAPGPGHAEGTPHTADYQAPFWQIDSTEVNRVLAYWRAGAFHGDPQGMDGFAPGP